MNRRRRAGGTTNPGEFARELSIRDITRVFRQFRDTPRVILSLFRSISRLFCRIFRLCDYFGYYVMISLVGCGCTNYSASEFPTTNQFRKDNPRHAAAKSPAMTAQRQRRDWVQGGSGSVVLLRETPAEVDAARPCVAGRPTSRRQRTPCTPV